MIDKQEVENRIEKIIGQVRLLDPTDPDGEITLYDLSPDSIGDVYGVTMHEDILALIADVLEGAAGERTHIPSGPCCDGECGGDTFADFEVEHGRSIARNEFRQQILTYSQSLREAYNANQ